MKVAGQTTLGFAGSNVLGITATSIGGTNKDIGFATAPNNAGNNSFMSSSRPNYGGDAFG